MKTSTTAVPCENGQSVELWKRREFLRSVLFCWIGAHVAPLPDLWVGRRSPVCLPPDPQWLLAWKSAARHTIWEVDQPLVRRLLLRSWLRRPVRFLYLGGSQPGMRRCVIPITLFRVHGYSHAYLAAYCTERKAERHFRLDRILWDG